MKKYLVIGNPIGHSLSPKLHNYWIKENNLDAIYEKKQINEIDIKDIINKVKNNEINGVNVTLPFKKSVISFLDELGDFAKKTYSVNTIYKNNNKIVGENTDVVGFKNAIEHSKYTVKGKKIFILGAGGVTSSIIHALNQMEASIIMLSNRTKEKAESLKKIYPNLELVNWGNIKNFDMIINTTSLGLKKNDKIDINYDEIGNGKFFYDLIYNPKKTNFLLEAQKRGNKIENGKMMFIYQAQNSFKMWTGILPQINEKVIKLLAND